MNTCLQIRHNDMFIYLLNLPDHQIFNASALLQMMTYPQRDRKEEIISIYLQKKTYEFINASFYKNNYTISALELKNKNLNWHLKRLKSSRSLLVQVARAKQSKKKQVSKIQASIHKANKVHEPQYMQQSNIPKPFINL
ncbi:893_t:CDS:2 [Racocetra persica]|uniref:893_t:CDS:1 n=1 Tax=Racocetra persica TaxID=160502 RepID=A0ACA9LVG4_9GLOM|nr:893_t:CDS:2 [Racocetra persica]